MGESLAPQPSLFQRQPDTQLPVASCPSDWDRVSASVKKEETGQMPALALTAPHLSAHLALGSVQMQLLQLRHMCMYMPAQRFWGQTFPHLISVAMDVFPNLYCVPGPKAELQQGVVGI